MCGRCASSRRAVDLAEEFRIDENRAKESLAEDYNVAPTKESHVVVSRQPKDSPEGAEPVRQPRTLKWGFYRT